MKDEYAGQGGSYEMGPDGTRRLVTRTLSQQEAEERANERSAAPAAAASETPAPVAPAAPKRAQQKE